VDLSKIVITLYDVFGYLLPGYVVLFACSIVEATFVGTPFLSLSRLGSQPVQFGVVAYFLGHISHSIASWVASSKRGRAVLRTSPDRLNPALCAAARAEISVAYGIGDDDRESLSRLEAYLLADAYLVAAGASAERDLLVAREGFFKQSVVAFAVLGLACAITALAGGVVIQTRPSVLTPMSFWTTCLATCAAASTAALFRLRFGFFHRIKVDNTMLLFLAHRVRERRAAESSSR
jgi:hypothetical protein